MEDELCEDVSDETVEAYTSRIGAPRSIAPVANFSVCVFLILAKVFYAALDELSSSTVIS